MRDGLCPVDLDGRDKACPAETSTLRLRQLRNWAARNLEPQKSHGDFKWHRKVIAF
jgi:hypothetical protein